MPYREVHYGFFRGGGLSPEEYGFLEPYVRSQTWRQRTRADASQVTPLVSWAYAFAPGFDPRSIRRMAIGPFTGASPQLAALGSAIRPYLRTRLDDAGVTEALASDEPGSRFVISGVVIQDRVVKDADGEVSGRRVQVEARVQQGGRSVGAIQANFTMPRHQTRITPGTGAVLLGSLLARATEPDITETDTVAQRAALYVANPFYVVRKDGAAQGRSPDHQNILFQSAASAASAFGPLPAQPSQATGAP